ncbi:hypothetical protein ACYZTL_03210 [Pseudomonas sp. LB3P81]
MKARTPSAMWSKIKAIASALENTPVALRSRAFARWSKEGWVEILPLDDWEAVATVQQGKLVADARESIAEPAEIAMAYSNDVSHKYR